MSVAYSVPVSEKRIATRRYRRNQALKLLRHLESTLISDLADGQALADVCSRLKMPERPKVPGRKNRPITDVIDQSGLNFLFRADDAEAFAGKRGKLNRRKMYSSANTYSFEGPVTVTRTIEQGNVHFSVTDGKCSFLVAFKSRRDAKSGLVVVRRGNFKPSSGRAAFSGRFAGRGPSAANE